MKSSGGFGSILFTAAIGLAVGGGAFFILRQSDQDKIRRLETNCQRVEARYNRAYEELDFVGQGNTTSMQRDTGNLVSKADFDALQQEHTALQTRLGSITASNATLLAELNTFAISNATLNRNYCHVLVSNNLLQVAGSSAAPTPPPGDTELQERYDEAMKSNSVLKSEYEIVVQMNEILQTEFAELKTNSIPRIAYNDMMLSNAALRAECDSLLRARANPLPAAEEGDNHQEEIETLMMSNAVLTVACEKAVQQNIELEDKYSQLKESSVDRATFDATFQSNLVLRTERAELLDANAGLRTQVEAALQSNAVLAAACERAVRQGADIEAQYYLTKTNWVDAATYDAALQSNAVLVAACAKAVQQSTDLEARYDQLKDNSVDRALYDTALQSNAVLVAACAKAVQQSTDLEARYDQLKDHAVDRAMYDTALQSNLVLRTEHAKLLDDNTGLRTQVDASLQSNAVLVARIQEIRHDSVARQVHYDVLWSNAVLRTANEALRVSTVPRTAYVSTVQSNVQLRAELTNLTKRHIVQTQRYIKLGDRFVALRQTHEKAEALLRAYRARLLQQQKQPLRTPRKPGQ